LNAGKNDEKWKGKEPATEETNFSHELKKVFMYWIKGNEPTTENPQNPSEEHEQWEMEIGRIKSNFIDVVGAAEMNVMEWKNPILLAMGKY
jgi:hypothetical protein